ncbi:two-component system sensor histidine kinase NtrB [Planctellipticum variicoloris]|uniref:two-component system sensor histidine kinase NtrB n=1 Tax=Planctellipticum variicoloris TaxID=3064265 RepID=UPI003013DA1D|nr:ATP-binding protein [Planctomycetaceae bacterium SH412]
MTKPRILIETLLPTLVVSLILGGFCLAIGIALLSDVGRIQDWSAAGRLWAWSGIVLGGLSACGAMLFAVRGCRQLQRSFMDVSERVHVAAQRLGSAPMPQSTRPAELLAQVRSLLEGIDRVLEERRQRECEVLRADQLAMVGQIAAGVAHELRNPLTSIKLLVQTNHREAGNQGLPTDDFAIIQQEIRRMERCLQQFLDFARPPRPEHRPVDLALLVERTLALVVGRARKQQVTLDFSPPPAPVVVEADEDQVQQLLVNLVLNALDAMSEGGRIEVRLPLPRAGEVELQVLDTGPGIPADLFGRLFDPFVSTKETGIGLGLAVSHRIASRHGGSLSAVNLPAGGACFTLRLPTSQRVAVAN